MSRTLAVLAVVGLAGTGFGAISYDDVAKTLTYGAPADLDSLVDPQGVLADVQESFGMTRDEFNALTPQVIGFNASTAAAGGSGHPTSVVAYYTASDTVSFTFPMEYNYGGYTTNNRSAFSGTEAYHMLGTVETAPDNSWLDAGIVVSAAGYGVGALGFCVHGRTDNPSGPGQAIFTLSDDTTEVVDYPVFGGGEELQRLFIGYQAPAGMSIKQVRCTRPGAGNSYLAVDDLAFIVAEVTALPWPGDTQPDGKVDGGDYTIWADNYGTTDATPWSQGGWVVGNFTEDTNVDGGDFTLWADNYGYGTAAAVPEPAALSVLAVGALALIRRKRRP